MHSSLVCSSSSDGGDERRDGKEDADGKGESKHDFGKYKKSVGVLLLEIRYRRAGESGSPGILSSAESRISNASESGGNVPGHGIADIPDA